MLSILADIGDPEAEARILSSSSDDDPEVSRAAKDALRALRHA